MNVLRFHTTFRWHHKATGVKWYKKWHDFRFSHHVHTFGFGVYVFSSIFALFLNLATPVMEAYAASGSWTQTTFSNSSDGTYTGIYPTNAKADVGLEGYLSNGNSASWKYKKGITVTNNSGNLQVDYPVQVNPFTDSNFINNNNLVGSWHLNGGTSGNIANGTTDGLQDLSGNNNHGTASNANGTGMAWTAGEFGGGVNLDGTDDVIVMSHSSTLSIAGDITVEAWVNPTSFGSGGAIIQKESHYALVYNGSGYISWADSTNWNFGSFGYQDIGLVTNSWQHIVITKTGSTVTIYLNGAQKFTKSFGSAITQVGSATVGVGCYLTNSVCSSFYVNGKIDEIKLYNRALSSTEVANRYGSGAPKIRGDYQDIRFTKTDGTELPYWQETDGQYWVKYSGGLNTGDTTINMYYGNPSATFGGTYANSTAIAGVFSQFDNAEAETVGQNPARWTTTERIATLVDVVNTPTYQNSTKAIKIQTDNGGTPDSIFGKSITNSASNGMVQFAVQTPSTTQGLNVTVSGTGGGILTLFYTGTSGFGLYAYYNATWNFITAASTNTWYKMQYYFDTGTDTYRIYMNGVSKATNVPFNGASSTNLTWFAFSQWNGAVATSYVDNIIYRKHAASTLGGASTVSAAAPGSETSLTPLEGYFTSVVVPNTSTHQGKVYSWGNLVVNSAGVTAGQTLTVDILDGATGNTFGFASTSISTSPQTIDLSSINSLDHPSLKLRAHFTSDGTATATLADWTLGYNYDLTAPTTPTSLATGAVTSNSIALSWTASTDTESSDGQGGRPSPAYEMQRAPDSSNSPGTWANISSGGCSGAITTNNCTDNSVASNTKYWYRVRAKDYVGNYSPFTTANATPWLDALFVKRKPITITNSGSALTDYQFRMTINYVAGMNSNFSDLRFSDSSGNVNLPYWIESYVASTSATVWVKVPNIAGTPTNTTIYMYYGNSGAANVSSGDGTFIFFDDFENGNLNKWTQVYFPAVGGTYAKDGSYGAKVWGNMAVQLVKSFPSTSAAILEYDRKTVTGWTYGGFDNVSTNVRYIGNSAADLTNQLIFDGAYTATGGAWTTNTWYSYKIAVTPSQTNYYINGTLQGYATSGASTDTRIKFYTGETTEGSGNGNAYFDNVKMRAYAAVEPTTSVGNEEAVTFNVNATTLVAVPSLDTPNSSQKVTKPTISGTGATPSTTVRLYDNGTMKASLTADGSGNFTFDASTPGYTDFAEGNHNNITVRGYNGSSETADSGAVTVFIDTQIPSAPTTRDAAKENDAGGANIDDASWNGHNNSASVYFAWSGATDPAPSSNIKRYWVYFGPLAGAVPRTDGQATADATANVTKTLTNPVSGTDYYLRIQTEDNAGNISSDGSIPTLFTYKFDSTAPSGPTTVVPNPSSWSTVNSFNFSWTNWTEADSGFDYYLYVRKETANGDTYESQDPVNRKVSDITNPIDLNNVTALYSGINWIRVFAVDKAGNVSTVYGSAPYFYSGTVEGPSIVASPSFNSQNSFSFVITKPGTVNVVGYYCGVSSPISSSNSTFIDLANLPATLQINGRSTNVTQNGNDVNLSAFGAATQSGVNQLYCATKDEFGNIGWTTATSDSFTVNTTPPAQPQNISIVDASNRGASLWALTVAWLPLTNPNSDFDGYRVERSTDGLIWSTAANVSTNIYSEAGLSNTTEYYYRIRSKDNTGNVSQPSTVVSRIPTGNYTSPPSLTSEPTADAKATAATINWTTNRVSNSIVQYGATNSYGQEVSKSTESVTNHEITILGLTPGVTYHYRVQALDEDRDYDPNSAFSGDYTFTTTQAPGISNVDSSEVRLTTAIITWQTTSAATSRILYGTSTSYGSTFNDSSGSQTTTHTVKLNNLKDSTVYHYRIQGTDIEGNVLTSDDYIFETLTFPKLSNLELKQVPTAATSTVEATFDSNVPITSSVTFAGKVVRNVDSYNLATDHKVTVSGLSDNSEYAVTVRGRDQYGNESASLTKTFKTDFDTRPPVVKNVTTETEVTGYGIDAKGQIIVSWETDEPATSQIEYGIGSSGTFTNKTQEDSTLSTTTHVVIISDLKTSSAYHFQVVSRDASGNAAKSSEYTILTPQANRSIFEAILGALDKAIGWLFRR